ncbi:MAG: TIGR02556 family CRISPR-associated protein [Desulfosarcina sp.]|nr:TIGR02556 family CRISPR-associated protein [Desulfobacterales bacterium]
MIQSIMKIGKWARKNEDSGDLIKDFIQNPNEKGNIDKVFEIILKQQEKGFVYEKVNVSEFSETRLIKYLYRHGSPRGSDVTPTSKFAGDIGKTFKNKIYKCIGDIEKKTSMGLTSDEQKIITQINKALSASEKDIILDLQKQLEDIDQKKGSILTLAFTGNGDKHYIGDMELFRKILQNKTKEKYYKQYGKESLGQDKICSVCHENQKEVYGFVNTYNFYTVDKPGFVSGGFKQQYAWKNYPVCYNCAVNLEQGKKYINENLSFSFYGFNYLLIPKFITGRLIEESMEILEYNFEQKASEILKSGFEKKFKDRLTDAENEIFDLISEQEDYISFDFLFYAEKQAAFNIILHIEDVLPSRLSKLFQIKAHVDQIDIFKRVKIDKNNEAKRLVFNFGILRDFFPIISKKRTYDKNFLELAGKIFSHKPIDYNFIMQAIVRKIRPVFINNKSTKILCLKGYMLLNFLAELGILSKGGVKMEVKIIDDLKESFSSADKTYSEKIERFFTAHVGFFDCAPKKACFLTGVLVRYLINIQKRPPVKGGKPLPKAPFEKKLQGLRLNEQLIKKLSFEAQNKLEQYKENYYIKLENIIAQYFVIAALQWALTNDEISFYFTTGMNLADLFKTKTEEEDNDGSDQ